MHVIISEFRQISEPVLSLRDMTDFQALKYNSQHYILKDTRVAIL